MSYWRVFKEASQALEQGSFALAEKQYLESVRLREQSPTTVFITESVLGKVSAMFKKKSTDKSALGKWELAKASFLKLFNQSGIASIDLIISDADTNQFTQTSIMSEALFLVSGSTLYEENFISVAELLKIAFNTTLQTEKLVDLSNLPEGLDIIASDRMELARIAIEILTDSPALAGEVTGRRRALTLGKFAQSILDDSLFPAGTIFDSDRLFYCAKLSDLVEDDSRYSAELYCRYLSTVDNWNQDSLNASLRAMVIFANIDKQYMHVPDYSAARSVPSPTGLDINYNTTRKEIRDTIRDRAGDKNGIFWASVTLEQGRWVFVIWSRSVPVDVISWAHPEDDQRLIEYLAKCEDRIICRDGTGGPVSTKPLVSFLTALCEKDIPAAGITPEFLTVQAENMHRQIQSTSSKSVKHPAFNDTKETFADRAVEAGYLWLGCINRIRTTHAAFRLGLHQMARRGDQASLFLQQFLDPELIETEEWPSLALAERDLPDLFSRYQVESVPQLVNAELASQEAAVISTGKPLDVLAAWSDSRSRLRVVIDCYQKLLDTTSVLAEKPGLITWLPENASVYSYEESMQLLVGLISVNAEELNLLPIFHWSRIIETHNGDLADFVVARPRTSGVIPFYEDYLERIQDLTLVPLSDSNIENIWVREMIDRLEDSTSVIGVAGLLDQDVILNDMRWGCASSSVDWVFLDSSVIHWQMYETSKLLPVKYHRQLSARNSTHLSLLTTAHFLRQDLIKQISDWIVPYGENFTMAINDQVPPVLKLAVMGIVPDATVGIGSIASSLLSYVGNESSNVRPNLVIGPRAGPLAECLSAVLPGFDGESSSTSLISQNELWADNYVVNNLQFIVPKLTSLDIDISESKVTEAQQQWYFGDQKRFLLLEEMRIACALEVNALLARSNCNLDIADSRWWRRFKLFASDGYYLPVPADAAAVCAGPSAVLYDLPAIKIAEQKKRRKLWPTKAQHDDSLVGAARQWLLSQGWIDNQGMGTLPGLLAPPGADLPENWNRKRARFAIGKQDNFWYRELLGVTQQREIGNLSEWLLYVSESAPPFGAAVLDCLPATGLSIISESEYSGYCPAIIWATPTQLVSSNNREKLLSMKPTSIYMSDIRQWLPPQPIAGARAGQALHHLLKYPDCRITAVASTLPEPWRKHFADSWKTEFTADGLFVDQYDDSSQLNAIEHGLNPVAVGRFTTPEVECRECGLSTRIDNFGQVCPGCGLSIGRWISPTQKTEFFNELLRLKISAIKERFVQRQDAPLCLWVNSLQWDSVELILNEQKISYKIQADRTLDESTVTGSWLICIVGQIVDSPAECQHALLSLPDDEQELLAFRIKVAGDVCLWFHPLEFESTAAANDPEWVSLHTDRYRHLLSCLHTPPGLSSKWIWDSCITSRPASILTGLPAEVVSRSLEVASWMMPVAFNLKEISGSNDHLELRMSMSEIKQRCNSLQETIKKVLPAMFATVRRGTSGRINLCALPVEIEPDDLAWLDRFLLASSLTLGSHESSDELLFCGDGGIIFSPLRHIGYLGSPGGVVDALLLQLESFWVFTETFISGDMDAARMALGDEVIDTGVLLGVWRLLDSTRKSTVALVEPEQWQQLDDEKTMAAGILLADLSREQIQWHQRLTNAWRAGFMEDVLPDFSKKEAQDEDQLICEIGNQYARELTSFLCRLETGQVVLRGRSGSCRVDSLISGLRETIYNGLPVNAISVYSPDTSSATDFHMLWRKALPGYSIPSISVCGREEWVGEIPSEGAVAIQPREEVAVILETQNMDTLDRYRIAQRFKNGRVISIYDPILATEEWEHMFLTTPSDHEIIDFKDKAKISRQVNDSIEEFLAINKMEISKSDWKHFDDGSSATHMTSNMDEAIADISNSCSGGVTIVAPLVADIEYIGRGLAQQGWHAVFNEELDSLLLPGVLEFIAAAFDLVAAEDVPSILEPLLPPSAKESYRRWYSGGDVSTILTVSDMMNSAGRSSWSKSLFDDPACRQRTERIVADAGNEPLDRFVSRPLFAAWRQEVSCLPGVSQVEKSTQVARLMTTDEISAVSTDTLAYLCRGSEPSAIHYKVICRAKNNLKVYYQERSPLSRDIQED